TCDCTWRDLRPFLDEALNHLPEKYRAPLVLHYLEGKTVEQAAQELGWPQGTVCGRLNRAKELLRKRLHRGGMVLSGAVCATALEQAAAAVAVPEALLTSTFKATLGMASEKTGAGSGKAAALAAAMLRTMAVARLKLAAMVLAIVAVVGLAGAIAATQHLVD